MRILILGASGMIGSALFKYLSSMPDLDVLGSVRAHSLENLSSLQHHSSAKIITDLNISNIASFKSVLSAINPDTVINAIGIIKQLPIANDVINLIKLNALFPHQLQKICKENASRLIHISTDCVYSGYKGYYSEDDVPDPIDLYGKTKALGEIYEDAITIRTSTIGYEIKSTHGLLEWFLSQKKEVKGYSRAIYSGITSLELGKILYKYVIFNNQLQGLYNVSSDSISKYSLLLKIKKIYNSQINIIEDSEIEINRSLNSRKFRAAVGYHPPSWDEMLFELRDFKNSL
ncbi:SDR family oxidoreductase [Polynucleobacter sp. IMCC30063]|uniref:dTDP-4-dehydrorhamnose reductase family protein n=1 Tax=Polynucleobacter sp. IMCC30063 TaxID=2907298 RepID=UPI001F20D5CA|nr:SDR family oxidoreductase [Polynucleobacter sp. IMCC30063]MCE7505276.1 SDR family oxidoreductase [Polynucleobacter sp. IMCC30063]